MLAGFAARVLVAFGSSLPAHADEQFQYLEQGFRLVHGYGVIPWEYDYGIRNWTIPGLVAGLLWVFQLLGLTTPAAYIPALEVSFSLISMSLPIGLYVWARNLLSARAALVALVLGCFWHDFVYFGSKPMPGALAAYALVWVGALLSGHPSARRWFWVGFLAGLTLILRFQIIPAVGLLGLYAIYRYPRGSLAVVLGGVLSLLIGGFVDYLSWGVPFGSFYENFRLNFVYDVASLFGNEPLDFYARGAFSYSWGFVAVGVIGALLDWRRFWPFIVAFGIGILALHIPAHKEHRFIFWALPLAMLGAAAFATHPLVTRVLSPLGRAAPVVIVLGYGLVASALGTRTYVDVANPITAPDHQNPRIGHQIMRELAGLDGVTAVYFDGTVPNWWATSGYFGLGRDVPIYFTPWNEDLRDVALAQADTMISHWVTSRDSGPEGWEQAFRGPAFAIYRNPEAPEAPAFPDQWSYRAPNPVGFDDLGIPDPER